MKDGPNSRGVRLPRKIPVYITYFTAYINNGELYFGNDLYGRDDKLVAVVMPGALPSKAVVDAVEALRRIARA